MALLSTAVVLSTLYSRFDGELDWSNYVVGLLATLGLLGVAALGVVTSRAGAATTGPGAGLPVATGAPTAPGSAHGRPVGASPTGPVSGPVAVPASGSASGGTAGGADDRRDRHDLVSWPGAFGALAVALMVGVAFDDSDATLYLAGLAAVLVAAGGYVLTRRAPFVVVAVLGLFVVYGQLVDDVLGTSDSGDDLGAVGPAVALLLFAVLVTAGGWLLPTRALSGVVVGALTVAGYATLTGVLAVTGLFARAMAGFSLDDQGRPVPRVDRFDDDAWVVLVLALLLMLGWSACAALTRHVGFRVLVVAMAVTVTPLATIVLAVEHPTWWGVVLGALGGALLVLVVLRALGGPGGLARAGGRGGGPASQPLPPLPPAYADQARPAWGPAPGEPPSGGWGPPGTGPEPDGTRIRPTTPPPAPPAPPAQ
ncbi:hypothetical protein [Nocardioides sp. P86]|uniref:hypothetical protein n=1 Tax=Nocardioides sp. P86 TaxID=2939569 RepID=UPI00203AFC30|nr:hypothetical protein [Nocardioides sp. P86]MCM3516524.1 hypothetical protein [Nocardioides sp. P86]